MLLLVLALTSSAAAQRRPPQADKQWEVRKPATVKRITPQSGGPGTVVVIEGQHFDANTRVRFNGQTLPLLSQSATQLKVKVPARNAVSDSFVIAKAGFEDVSTERFDVLRAPSISGFAPARGDVGIELTIEGTHFARGDEVLIGKAKLRVTELTPSRITATLTAGAASGKLNIRRGGKIVATSRGVFEVAGGAVAITGFKPTSGKAGTVVRISGRAFEATDRIELNGEKLTVKRRGATFIDVLIGKQHATGTFRLVGSSGREASADADFVVARKLAATGFSPAAGGPGTRVTIRGGGFARGDQVFLGKAELTVRNVSDTQLVAELPAGVQSGKLSVRRGASSQVLRGTFRVLLSPEISSIVPAGGPAGTQVAIRGSNLTKDVKVLLSGEALPIVRKQLPGAVFVRIPTDARTGKLTVLTAAGSVQSAADFVVQPFATLSSFFPLRGKAGTRVTLKGTDFHRGMKAYLGTQPLALSAIESNSAVVTIAAGAKSGAISIETFGKKVSSKLTFTVEQAGAAFSFTFAPLQGKRGSEVTLTLNPPRQDITVYYGGRPLPARELQQGAQVVVTIPSDAKTAHFEIDAGGQRHRAAKPFKVR